MFCRHCGKEVSDQAVICPSCGCEVKQTVQMEKTNAAKTLAIIGFVCSFLFSLAGLIISIIALNKYKTQEDQSCKGLATAGLIISIIAIALVVLIYIFVLSTVGAIIGSVEQYAAISCL